MTAFPRPEQTGHDFESNVRSIIANAGGRFAHRDHQRHGVHVGLTCYGLPWYVDAVIENATAYRHGLIVECKWQESDGSADEKFPYLVMNARRNIRPTIVVYAGRNARVQGEGMRQEAIDWLKRQVDSEHVLAVLTLEELIPWLRRLTFLKTQLF